MVRQLCALALATLLTVGPASAGSLTVLYRFPGGADGAHPGGPLVLDAGGDLYGSASAGGSGKGVVFRLSPTAATPWTETVLYTFSPASFAPNAGLAMDGSGALYGAAFGTPTGDVFRLAPPSAPDGSWSYSVLATFPGFGSPLGGGAVGVPTVDRAGDVWGATAFGGSADCKCGLAYALPRHAGGERTERVLHAFLNAPDGGYPYTGLIRDRAGALYGTTAGGGSGQCLDGSGVAVVGCGTVFKLTRAMSGVWSETQLYSFTLNEGNQPADPLAFGPGGALYGTANLDVYRLTPGAPGAAWQKQTIYSFPGGVTGTAPTGGLLFDPAGKLYGVTRSFGIDGPATVFRLSPPVSADASWALTTLATIANSASQTQPNGGLVRAPDGTLYGAAGDFTGRGYIFAVAP